MCPNDLLVLFRLQLQSQLFPKALTVQWLISASGTYSRAARKLATDIVNSNLQDIETCRLINDRIMVVRPVFECKNRTLRVCTLTQRTLY